MGAGGSHNPVPTPRPSLPRCLVMVSVYGMRGVRHLPPCPFLMPLGFDGQATSGGSIATVHTHGMPYLGPSILHGREACRVGSCCGHPHPHEVPVPGTVGWLLRTDHSDSGGSARRLASVSKDAGNVFNLATCMWCQGGRNQRCRGNWSLTRSVTYLLSGQDTCCSFQGTQ